MEHRLDKLGFDASITEYSDLLNSDGFEPARITEVHKESYIATNGIWQSRAEVTGKMMFSAESPLDFPTVGDWCSVQYFGKGSRAVIHEVLPRKSMLKRKAPGRRIEFQPIAANLDFAFIVQAIDADFNLRRLERYLVMVRDGRISPVILLSKSDLAANETAQAKIREVQAAYPKTDVFLFSSETGAGLDSIRSLMLKGMTYCLLGSSGVGKTTLLNKLIGKEIFETREIREKDGKGRHTTTGRQLIILENGSMIIDTPGMRELGNFGVGEGIDSLFDEIAEIALSCKFNDCSHQSETGCAIAAAIDEAIISREKYDAYVKLSNESAHYEMSFLEKKRKARKLGKLYKSIQQQKSKNR